MNLLDLFVLLLSVFAVGIIVILIYRILFPPVILVEQPIATAWWPWTITSYNYWPAWHLGGGGGGDHGRGGHGRGHGGGHGGGHRPWGGSGRGAHGGGFHH